jgi:protein SCO1/2
MLRTLLASAAVALAGGIALAAATDGFQAFTTEAARRVAVQRHPDFIPDAVLETNTGARVALSDLRGKWLLVDFIYTRCPTYCTALGSDFAQLQQRLAAPLAQRNVALVSISFDPAHDSPARLAAYLARSGDHGSGWIAARPVDAAGLERLMRGFGVIAIADGAGGYVHNVAVHVVDPQGRLVEILDSGDPQRIEVALSRRLAP